MNSTSGNDTYWNSTLWQGTDQAETLSLAGVNMLLGLSSALGFLILETIAADILYTGSGPDDQESLLLLKIQFISNYVYDPGLYYAKFAMLSFYLSLIPETNARTRWALYGIVAFTVIGFIVSVLGDTFWCGPDPSMNLLPERQEPGQCSVQTSFSLFYTTWALHFTSETMIFLFPFPVVTRMKLERRARIALYALFCLGLLTLGMSLSRLLVFMRAAVGELDPKVLYILWPAELCSSLIVVGLSACRPLLTRVTHFFHGAWSNTAQALGVSSRGTGSGQQGSGGGASMPQIATIGSGRAIKARGGDSQWLVETRVEESESDGYYVEGGGGGPSIGETNYSRRSATDQDSTKMLVLDPILMEDLGRETKLG
ncbi:hypothetical protein MAPG_01444 [Magnaporthiopsis poae ATCC 64411]|uniref:Rhodopsin domain-containing protein n=1 Tax=Magnaporthiopsis poae (strain ATCC 64411 / 73-15) TaxID=644358 RepID=A0A0C4DNQ0_MAGP6|nr:hypothetical protein MAPG_01444 [Magnaporthiopsis poae ATCC 64411]